MIPGDTGSIISSVGSSPTLVGEEIGVSERRSRRDLWPDDRRRSSTGNCFSIPRSKDPFRSVFVLELSIGTLIELHSP